MRATRLAKTLAVWAAGVAAITTATCDPYTGTIDIFRDDDHNDFFFDGFVTDVFVEECSFFDCYF